MPSFAASWETLLVFLVIVLLSAVSNWLKQRQARRQHTEAQRGGPTAQDKSAVPPPLPTPQEMEGTDWEGELRRLFGEEPEPLPPPPPLRPVAPPPVTRPGPAAPMRQPEPVIVRPVRPPPIEPEPERRPVVLRPGTHFAPTARALDSQEAPEFVLAPLAESAAALHRASHLQEEAIARLHRASARTLHHVPATAQPRERHPSPEIDRVLAQLRQPRTAREAILATVMLGPPRALEPQS